MAETAAYVPKPSMGGDELSRHMHVMRELEAISRYLGEFPIVELRQRDTAPSKPRIGLIAYADGTHWNPGSGEGLYVYKLAGWTFIA